MKRILLLAICLVTIYSLAKTQTTSLAAGNNFSDSSVLVQRNKAKKNVVKIEPNPSFGKLSVSAINGASLHFYIFDIDGTLVFQTMLKNKEKKIIDNLKKGTYLYDAFEKDESVDEGQILVR